MKLKHIIFDFDGTLADSEALHFQGWNKALEPYNIVLEDYNEYLKTFAGVPTNPNSQRLIETYNLPTTVEAFSELREDAFHEILEQHKPEFMPYALETLDYFKAKGLPLYLVTGSPRRTIDIIFKKTDLGKYFEFVITRSDVTHSKPHPESYLKAIENINDDPAGMIVFEDTKSGVTAAKGAGLTCFAIQHDGGLHPNLTLADKIFDNLQDAITFLETENRV